MQRFLFLLQGMDIAFIVQIYVAEFLVFSGIQVRKRGYLFFFGGMLVSALVSLMSIFLWPRVVFNMGSFIFLTVIRYLILFSVGFVSLYLTYHCTPLQAVFYSITGYIMQHLASCIAWWIGWIVFPEYVGADNSRVQYITCAVCVVLYTLLYFTFLRNIKKSNFNLPAQPLPMILSSTLILLSSSIINIVFIVLLREHPEVKIYPIILCTVAIFLQGSFSQNSRILEEKEHIEYLLKMQGVYGDMAKESINAINIKYHDMKKQLAAICEIDSPEELLAYKSEMTDSISDYELIANTGNEALNAVITERFIYCASKGIKFTYMADGKLISFLAPHDIYSMIGNILDNAVEAVGDLEPEQQIINLIISKRHDMVIIHAENFFDGRIVTASGALATKKQDDLNHGFGLKSIELIADKYGGAPKVSIEDNVFVIDVILPLKDS